MFIALQDEVEYVADEDFDGSDVEDMEVSSCDVHVGLSASVLCDSPYCLSPCSLLFFCIIHRISLAPLNP